MDINMNVMTKNYLLLITGLLLGVLISIGHGVFAEREASRASLPVEELRTFSVLFGRIKNDYVEPVEDKELLEDAIRGMLNGLDPHSSFLNTDRVQRSQDRHHRSVWRARYRGRHGKRLRQGYFTD